MSGDALRRWMILLLVPLLSTVLAGCGEKTWDGSGPAACPYVKDIVRPVTKGLVADPEGRGSNENGRLPVTAEQTGELYQCQWAAAEGKHWGVRVLLHSTNDEELEAEQDRLDQRDGTALTGGGASGHGEAWAEEGAGGRAYWLCHYRVLDVEVYAADGDPVSAVQRIAEAIIPQAGCAGG
jgi:hypothetical protein